MLSSYRKNTAIILFIFLASAVSTLEGQRLDITHYSKYFRSGFDSTWVNTQPKIERGWLALDESKHEGFPSFHQLEYPEKEKRHLFSFKKSPDKSFTLSVLFDFKNIESNTPYTLHVKSISYYWQIYLNGQLIDSHWKTDGEKSLLPFRGKNKSIPIPDILLKHHDNLLTFRVAGSPHHRWTGFYYSGPVFFAPTDRDILPNNDFLMVSMLGVLLLLGVFWLVFATIEKNNKILFVLTAWCFSYALFFLTRIDHLLPFRPSAFLLIRAEYIAVFISSMLFPLFLDVYQKRLSLFTKIFSPVFISFALLTFVVPLSFVSDLNFIWQRLIPLYLGYVLFRSIQYFQSQPAPKLTNFVTSGTGIVLFAFLIHGAFVTRDVFFIIQSHLDELSSRYTMVFSTITLSVVLITEFIQGYVKTRGWGDQLEEEINLQTKELREAKEYLESVFENSKEGIAIFNKGINLVRCNQAYLNLFGYTFEEYKALTTSDLYDNDGLEMLLDAREKAFNTGIFRLIVPIFSKAGKMRQLSLSGSRVKSKTGEEIYIVNAFDMTDRINTENQLRETQKTLLSSNEELEAIFKALPDLYFRLDKDGRYLSFQGQKNLIYKSEKTIIGDKISDRLPSDVGDLVMNAIYKVIDEQVRVTIEYKLELPEGFRTFEAVILPYRENEVISGIRDITERRVAEKNLYKSEEQYRTLVEGTEDLIFSINTDGIITFVNIQVLIHYEKELEDFIGEKISDVVNAVDSLDLSETIAALNQTGQMNRIKTNVIFPKFTSWFEFTLNPQRGKKGGEINSILCIGHNIDEQQSYESHLERLVEQLNEQRHILKKTSVRILNAQENERSRISRELHDEVGQTLTAIDLNLQLVRQRSENKEDVGPLMVECQQMVQNTAKEIHRFSRDLHPAILDDMGLFPAIASYIRSFEKRTKISVNFDPPDNFKEISDISRTLVYRIFQESLTNASKHSKADIVSVKLNRLDGVIHMIVSDNGIGFPGDIINNMSSRFGLQGIDERVQLAGGVFSISSSISGGAELNIEIPNTLA
jgi:PAS domain S-box-containing protein